MAYTEKSISAVGSRGNHKFTLNFYENSYDTSGNTSNCSFDLILSAVKTGYDWYYSNNVPVKVSVNINGNSYSANVMSYDGRSTVVVLSGSNISLTHNDDGTLNASISFYEDTLLSASYLPGDCSASANVQLTDIPRKAILTSADNFTDEDNPTIYYDCKAKDIISSLVACISFDGVDEGIRYRSVSKNESSYTFQFSEEEITLLRNQCPVGSSTKEMTFFLRSTINGEYFYSSLVKTFSVVNGQPTVDAYAIETDQNKIALTGRNSKIIKGYNNVNAYMFVTPKKGAEIIQNSISNDGKAVNVTDTYFRNTKSNVFQFYTEDSRGNVVNKQVTLDMVDYFPPSCIMEVTPPTTDGRMTITAKGNFFNGSFGSRTNSLTVRYRYKTNNDSWTGWYTMSATKSGNTYSASYTVTGLNYRNRYTVQVQAEDLLDIANSDEKSVRSIPLFDWSENDFRFHIPVEIEESGKTYDVLNLLKNMPSIQSGEWYPTQKNNIVIDSYRDCNYYRIGRLVYVEGVVTARSGGASSGDRANIIGGLPFPIASKTRSHIGITYCNHVMENAAWSSMGLSANGNWQGLNFLIWSDGRSWEGDNCLGDSNGEIHFSGMYLTN